METVRDFKFVICHRYATCGADCLPGEEVLGIWHVSDVSIQLPVPLSERLLFDYFARHRWVAQNSAQIVGGMRIDPFYARHAANAHAGKVQIRRFTRAAIRVYVARLRQAIQLVLDAARADIRADSVLRSEPTIGNEIRYRLHAKVEWKHFADSCEPSHVSLSENVGASL